jgi:hypothetical protein
VVRLSAGTTSPAALRHAPSSWPEATKRPNLTDKLELQRLPSAISNENRKLQPLFRSEKVVSEAVWSGEF